MGMLGTIGLTWVDRDGSDSTEFTGQSSFVLMPVVGRPLFNTIISTGLMGTYYYQNPATRVAYAHGVNSSQTFPVTRRAFGAFWTTGQVLGADSLNRLPQYLSRSGYDNRSRDGIGNIQLITPVLVQRVGPDFTESTFQIAILTIRVPEPWSTVLLITGLATLCGLYRLRRR